MFLSNNRVTYACPITNVQSSLSMLRFVASKKVQVVENIGLSS